MSIDTNGRSHVPAGVRAGGQFATDTRGESAVSLLEPATLTVEDNLARVIAPAVAENGPGFESIVRQEFDALVDQVGPDVPPEYVAALFEANHRLRNSDHAPLGSRWAAGSPQTAAYIRDAYETGMPADWPDQMEARNAAAEPARKAAWDAAVAAGQMQGVAYSPSHNWSDRCVERWAKGLTADELQRLDAAGLAMRPEVAAAYVGCDTATVRRWLNAGTVDTAFGGYVNRYLGYQGIGQYVRGGVPLDDVRLCHELDVEPGLAAHGLARPDGTVEKGPGAIRELAGCATAAGRSTDEAHEGIAAGLPAGLLKEYGSKVTVKEIPALQSAGVPGKVARSLRAKNQQMPVEFMAKLHAAGISTGADLRAWESAVEVTTPRGLNRGSEISHDWDAAMSLSRSGVPAAAAAALRHQRVPIGAIGDFHTAGVSDLSPWVQSLHRRVQGRLAPSSDAELAAYRGIAAFAKAGGTPEQMRRAQRAGIDLTDVAAYVTSTPDQLWAAGATNREAVMAQERGLFERWGSSWAAEPQPWDVAGPDDL